MSKLSRWILSPAGTPAPGYYRAKMIKGGPFVPISLRLFDGDRDADGKLMSDQKFELTVDREVFDWTTYQPLTGEPIDEAEYQHLVRCRDYDTTYVPALAEARVAIDLLEIGRLF